MRSAAHLVAGCALAIAATMVRAETAPAPAMPDVASDARLGVVSGGVAPGAFDDTIPAQATDPIDGLRVSGADAGAFDGAPPNLEGFRPVARPAYMLRYPVTVQAGAAVRPMARDIYIPDARWDNRPDGDLWTLAALTALRRNAPGIVDVVPRDIDVWCPAYRHNTDARRRAFWVGLMSALSWHESRHRPAAVGGGNQWFGLMQIFPPTARGYRCTATTGAALTDPFLNLSCATRIMAVTVARDNAIAINDGRWRGIAADWGPMVSTRKREEMIDWVSGQDYCVRQLLSVPRPPSRPVTAPPTTVASTTPLLDGRVSTSGVPRAVVDRLAAGTLDFDAVPTPD